MLYRDGAEGLPADLAQAKSFFQKACKQAATACDNLGAMLLEAKDEEGATAAFKAGCELPEDGEATAKCCFKLGLSYENGWGILADKARAASLYAKACDRAVADACYSLGLAEMASEKKQDAAGHFRRACAGGVAGGCNNLGLMYASGLGIPKDGARAVEFLEKGCEGGELRACANVGSRYVLGDGVAKDPERGERLIQHACKGGVAEACQPPIP